MNTKSKFNRLEEYVNFLNNDINFVVYINGPNSQILSIEDVLKNDQNVLISSVFIGCEKNTINLHIGRHSESFNFINIVEIKGFKTLNEAKNFLLTIINSNECKKWDISNNKINNYIKKKNISDSKRKKKRKEKLLIELKGLRDD
jgi:hypothetical protein